MELSQIEAHQFQSMEGSVEIVMPNEKEMARFPDIPKHAVCKCRLSDGSVLLFQDPPAADVAAIIPREIRRLRPGSNYFQVKSYDVPMLDLLDFGDDEDDAMVDKTNFLDFSSNVPKTPKVETAKDEPMSVAKATNKKRAREHDSAEKEAPPSKRMRENIGGDEDKEYFIPCNRLVSLPHDSASTEQKEPAQKAKENSEAVQCGDRLPDTMSVDSTATPASRGCIRRNRCTSARRSAVQYQSLYDITNTSLGAVSAAAAVSIATVSKKEAATRYANSSHRDFVLARVTDIFVKLDQQKKQYTLLSINLLDETGDIQLTAFANDIITKLMERLKTRQIGIGVVCKVCRFSVAANKEQYVQTTKRETFLRLLRNTSLMPVENVDAVNVPYFPADAQLTLCPVQVWTQRDDRDTLGMVLICIEIPAEEQKGSLRLQLPLFAGNECEEKVRVSLKLWDASIDSFRFEVAKCYYFYGVKLDDISPEGTVMVSKQKSAKIYEVTDAFPDRRVRCAAKRLRQVFITTNAPSAQGTFMDLIQWRESCPSPYSVFTLHGVAVSVSFDDYSLFTVVDQFMYDVEHSAAGFYYTRRAVQGDKTCETKHAVSADNVIFEFDWKIVVHSPSTPDSIQVVASGCFNPLCESSYEMAADSFTLKMSDPAKHAAELDGIAAEKWNVSLLIDGEDIVLSEAWAC